MDRHTSLRILLVAPQPFFQVRGTPLNVLQMCRALTAAGHEVHLATYPYGEDVELPGLTIHRSRRAPGIRTVPIGFSKRKIVLDLFLAATVYRLLLKHRFDVVHAVEESVFFSLPGARLAGVPVIYDLDSSISDQLEYVGVLSSGWLLDGVRRVERAALQRATCALTVCRALTEFVEALSPETRVFQIEDTPLPSSLREPDPSGVARLRTDLGIEGRRVLLYTGNLESYQGIDLLTDAAEVVARLRPAAVFLLVGGNPEQVSALERRVADLGLTDHVLLAGSCPPDEIPEYMAMAEVLLSPRRRGQNTPLKIYTYMNSGRPIVATDMPAHTQVLDPSVAVLTPPTPKGFAEGILRVLDDRGLAADLGAAARRRVEREFSFEAFQRKLAEVYEFVVGTPGGEAGATERGKEGPASVAKVEGPDSGSRARSQPDSRAGRSTAVSSVPDNRRA